MSYYYDEDEWMEFRAQCLEFEYNRHKEIIEKWCKECNVTTPVGYDDDYRGTLTIYTNRPGYLIGKGGEKVRKFEEAYSKEFRKPYKVKFVEIRGGIVNLNKEQGKC